MRKSILLIGDIAILYGALFLTLIIRYGGEFSNYASLHAIPFSIIFAIWLIVFYIANLYDLGFIKNNLQFFSAYFYAMAINIGIAMAFFYFVPIFRITPKTNLFIFAALILALEVAWRALYNKILVKSGYRNNTLIVGLNDQARELYDFLLANRQIGYNALGIIDVQNKSAAETLEKIITEKDVQTLVISREIYTIPHIIDVLYRLVPLRLKIYNMPKFFEHATGKIPLATIDQSWFLDNLSEGNRRVYEIIKRAVDFVGSVVLALIALPFCAAIILANLLYASGPIFYQQIRKGHAGKNINILKFRTMIPDAEKAGPVWAVENDQRVTSLGRFLRKTRLDEIPQLWNVFKGDLSLVGPRPERPEFHSQLSDSIPFYNERYLIKPGLMGWAQLKYNYGASVQDALEKLQYDLYYIKNRSILLDISIVLRTLNIVLRQAGR